MFAEQASTRHKSANVDFGAVQKCQFELRGQKSSGRAIQKAPSSVTMKTPRYTSRFSRADCGARGTSATDQPQRLPFDESNFKFAFWSPVDPFPPVFRARVPIAFFSRQDRRSQPRTARCDYINQSMYAFSISSSCFLSFSFIFDQQRRKDLSEES